MTSKSLSLIVPAYKEEKIIVREINSLHGVLSKFVSSFEIIVVVDGFKDDTYPRIKREESSIKNLKVFGYKKNMGKGYAVKYGVEKADKEIVGFIDSGMDINPADIEKLIQIMEDKDADIVIGSKSHPASKINYPFFRRILSSSYRCINKTLFGLSVRDTQVGLKIFKKNVAKEIFERVETHGFAFDIETLLIAKELGFKNIVEAPVNVNFKNNTINYLNFLSVAFLILLDTLKIFYKFRILHSYKK